MSTSDVLKVLKIARAVGESNLRTFKTSRVTINPEMHEQVHDFLFIIYLTKFLSRRLFFELFVLEFFRLWVYFSFSHPSIQPGLCSY